MTKEAIIEAVRRLSPEKRHEIAEALWGSSEEDLEFTEKAKRLSMRGGSECVNTRSAISALTN